MYWAISLWLAAASVGGVAWRVRRAQRVWHVIERPEADWSGDCYDTTFKGYTGKLEVCVDRHIARRVMPVGVCDFDDDEERSELLIKAEQRRDHLNSVRNET